MRLKCQVPNSKSREGVLHEAAFNDTWQLALGRLAGMNRDIVTPYQYNCVFKSVRCYALVT